MTNYYDDKSFTDDTERIQWFIEEKNLSLEC